MMGHDELVKFLKDIRKLKLMPRSGWIYYKIKNLETIGSHSFGTAILSLILAQGKKLNEEKIIKMALFHDLAEARTGDLTPRDKGYKFKNEIERENLKTMVKNLPLNLQNEIIGLVEEFIKGKTKEAEIVKTADLLDAVFMALEYEKRGKKLNEFFQVKFKDPFAQEFYEYLKSLRE